MNILVYTLIGSVIIFSCVVVFINIFASIKKVSKDEVYNVLIETIRQIIPAMQSRIKDYSEKLLGKKVKHIKIETKEEKKIKERRKEERRKEKDEF